MLWPLALVALRGQNRARLSVALTGIACITVWRIYAAQTGGASAGALYIRSDFRFDAPLFGCALALALRVLPRALRWSNSTGMRSATLAAAGLGGLAAWMVLRLGEVVYAGTEGTAVCILSVLLILSQIGVQGRGSRGLAWAPLVLIGQVSYGIYLWQQLFLGPQAPGFTSLRTFPVGLIATFAMATLSHVCLERPLLRLKDRRFHSSGTKAPAPIFGGVTGSLVDLLGSGLWGPSDRARHVQHPSRKHDGISRKVARASRMKSDDTTHLIRTQSVKH